MPESNHWDARSGLIARELSARGKVLGLSHPSYPFCFPLAQADLQRDLIFAGTAYLRTVWPVLSPPASLTLDQRGRFFNTANFLTLGWLPVDDDPRNSLLVKRHDRAAPGSPPLDQSVTLFAALATSDGLVPLGSRLGLRVHAWVRPVTTQPGQAIVGITGMAVSADLFPSIAQKWLGAQHIRSSFADRGSVTALVNVFKSAAAAAQGVDPDKLSIDGLRPLSRDGYQCETYQTLAPDARQAGDLPQAQTVLWKSDEAGSKWSPVGVLQSYPLVACANARPRLFRHLPDRSCSGQLVDPASQSAPDQIVAARPNRSGTALERFRARVTIDLGRGVQALEDSNQSFVVRQSRLANAQACESCTLSLDAEKLPTARADNFSAVSAFHQTGLLFRAIDATGLARDEFFRFAEAPLVVRYRAAIVPGPGKDGKTVNAQVAFEGPHCDLMQSWTTARPGRLQVRFALADLRRSSSSREPLGLAADPRWSWHEFCHVMLAGATGKLELAFVHSLGDALAAVACDPLSTHVAEDRSHGLRGATYPWVYINRRHDRPVRLGWSWSGTFHRPSEFFGANRNCRHKGYDTEQILSTTLFRLYRILGGDTVLGDGAPHLPARQAASDYVVYLVMRVIALLGAASAVPLETAEQLAAALADADVATHADSAGPLRGRVGGCAFKPIRWTFEAQGMYAGVPVDEIHDAPGNPPGVDLYVDNGRPDSEGLHPRGGYMPVSLDWNTDRPAWHATGDDVAGQGAIVVAGDTVWVTVGNRGRDEATHVRVTVSWIRWRRYRPAPDWDPGQWQHCVTIGPTSIPGWGSARFQCKVPFPGPAGRRYLLLARVDADQDLSCIAPTTALPSSAGPVALRFLVAGDNNLGLRIYSPD